MAKTRQLHGCPCYRLSNPIALWMQRGQGLVSTGSAIREMECFFLVGTRSTNIWPHKSDQTQGGAFPAHTQRHRTLTKVDSTESVILFFHSAWSGSKSASRIYPWTYIFISKSSALKYQLLQKLSSFYLVVGSRSSLFPQLLMTRHKSPQVHSHILVDGVWTASYYTHTGLPSCCLRHMVFTAADSQTLVSLVVSSQNAGPYGQHLLDVD